MLIRAAFNALDLPVTGCGGDLVTRVPPRQGMGLRDEIGVSDGPAVRPSGARVELVDNRLAVFGALCLGRLQIFRDRMRNGLLIGAHQIGQDAVDDASDRSLGAVDMMEVPL